MERDLPFIVFPKTRVSLRFGYCPLRFVAVGVACCFWIAEYFVASKKLYLLA